VDDVAVRARFDDLGPGGASFVLSEPTAQLVARDLGSVAGVVRAAEEAARAGHWVAGFVTYEAAPGLDPSLPSLDWPPGHPLASLPLAWFGVFARREEVAAPSPEVWPAPADERTDEGRDKRRGWQLDRDHAWHRHAVADIQEAIAAGDYYQLNLTARLTGTMSDMADPADPSYEPPTGPVYEPSDTVYEPLAAAQAGRYNALIVTPDHTVISASPELFFSARGDRVVTRPMKGTAPRGRWPEEDRRRAEELRSSAKERAENVMIVDLVRNDLGRLAEVGTVDVAALFDAERYPTVWQLTSTVAAQIGAGVDLAGLFAALFPSGSVTGAPKRAAMRAISEIEQRPRGVYCGAVGYLEPLDYPSEAPRPAARFSVAIRTITCVNRSGYAEYGTGGAITADSDADAEWAELLTKTVVLHPPPRPAQLIETLRREPPRSLVNLERHLARLRASADYFAFAYDLAGVETALSDALAHRPALARVRIRLEPSGRVHVDVGELGVAPAVVCLALADHPVRSDDVLLFHKQADRQRYDGFRRSRPDADDVVLWNEAGQVTETTIANLAVHLDGRWWTPPLSCGLLPGIERARLVEEGVLAERIVTIDDLLGAPDVAVVSSLRGWRLAKVEV
jgi:para-aminobenzoate synthetase / 4-amino-4-deoxychorismate lyase